MKVCVSESQAYKDSNCDWHKIQMCLIAHYNKFSVYAKPYVDAMLSMNKNDKMYMLDGKEEILIRFLCNAQGWRGEDAKECKKLIKTMIKKYR